MFHGHNPLRRVGVAVRVGRNDLLGWHLELKKPPVWLIASQRSDAMDGAQKSRDKHLRSALVCPVCRTVSISSASPSANTWSLGRHEQLPENEQFYCISSYCQNSSGHEWLDNCSPRQQVNLQRPLLTACVTAFSGNSQ